MLGGASLGGDGKAAHAAVNAGERGVINSNVLERAHHNGGDEGGGWYGFISEHVGSVIGVLEFREEGWADRAASSQATCNIF